MGRGEQTIVRGRSFVAVRSAERALRTFLAALVLGALLLPIAVRADGESVAELVARMDERWEARASGEAVRELVDIGQRALEIEPRSFEVTWRIARAHWWLANTQENRTLKKALAVKGIEWAERAIEIEPRRVEGHYVHGISIGEYATCVGIGRAILDDVGGKFEDSMHKSYELDRDIDNGGPMIALGRYYYVMPWPIRDYPASRRLLEELKDRHPNALLGRVFLAETYYEIGERDSARVELEYVLSAEPSRGWPDFPKPKPIAEQRLAEWFA